MKKTLIPLTLQRVRQSKAGLVFYQIIVWSLNIKNDGLEKSDCVKGNDNNCNYLEKVQIKGVNKFGINYLLTNLEFWITKIIDKNWHFYYFLIDSNIIIVAWVNSSHPHRQIHHCEKDRSENAIQFVKVRDVVCKKYLVWRCWNGTS